MTNIALPLWLLIALVAIPNIGLLVLALSKIKARRKLENSKPEQVFSADIFNQEVNSTFQNDLCALQIDAVFNALSALIETERLKLKSLLCSTVPTFSPPSVALNHQGSPPEQTIADPKKGISQEIAARAAAGESKGDIAHAFGISRSEVELAMSLNGESADDQAGRLEAVA